LCGGRLQKVFRPEATASDCLAKIHGKLAGMMGLDESPKQKETWMMVEIIRRLSASLAQRRTPATYADIS